MAHDPELASVETPAREHDHSAPVEEKEPTTQVAFRLPNSLAWWRTRSIVVTPLCCRDSVGVLYPASDTIQLPELSHGGRP
jgi:hypothetical protein